MASLSELREQLRYANEGLAQMQEPDAGYFEDPEHPTPEERAKLDNDVNNQCEAIARIEKQIANKEKEL